MTHRKRFQQAGFAIFVFGFLLIEGLEYIVRPFAIDGVYFQSWSSETMMQTVSIQDLRDAPLLSLYYIHVQPPGFDALRALLVAIWPSVDIHVALHNVDMALYLLWALLFGLMGYMLFVWLTRLVGFSTAIIASLLFLLHPATIYYASYLDTTFLSALLILWMFYLLWRLKNGLEVSMVLFAFVVLALFWFRSIFQLPTIILLLVCLRLLHVSYRKLLIFTLIAGGISGIYILKQVYVFHQFSTSSFTGQNLMSSIGLKKMDYPLYLDDPAHLQANEAGLPGVLTRLHKVDGAPNFNNINYLPLDQKLLDQYFGAVRSMSSQALATEYLENIRIYWMPSSEFTGHEIVDRLPWRSLYDRVFSYPVLAILLLLAGIPWIWNVVKTRSFTSSLALILIALYIFAICVATERAEEMRYKYFLEPVLYAFIVAQFYGMAAALVRWLSSNYPRTFRPPELASLDRS